MDGEHREYIKTLFFALEHAAFTFTCGGQKSEALDYGEGVERLIQIFCSCKKDGGALFFAGNGGSAAIASHNTADFMKNGGMRTVSLQDASVLTCLGNDTGFENIYSLQIERLAKKGDVLVAISSSGNSPDIVNAVEAARNAGAKTVTFTGFDAGNKVRKAGDANVWIDCMEYGIVESAHQAILQQIVDTMLKRGE